MTYFTPFSIVSIASFEQVCVRWEEAYIAKGGRVYLFNALVSGFFKLVAVEGGAMPERT